MMTAVRRFSTSVAILAFLTRCAPDGAANDRGPSTDDAISEGGSRGNREFDSGTTDAAPGSADGSRGPSAPSALRPDTGARVPSDGSLTPGEASARDADSQDHATSATDAASADQPTTVADAGGTAGADSGTAVVCPSSSLRPGDTRLSLEHDGMTRSFIVHVPARYDNMRPVPLVLNFHGATMTAALQQQTTGMNAKADEAGFVVVYPDGFDRSWNAGACCGGAASDDVDDVGFARALVESMRARVCVDVKRIYATGFSNGGRMSYRLGCEAADLFAAIAPVAGTKSFPALGNAPGCMPKRPLSLIDIMGSADSRIDAQPGQIAEWRKFNGCTDAEPKETYRSGRHVCHSYQQCSAGTSVTYCVVDGLGHSWPSSGFSANDRIWELFERSSL